jgi:hypothetical protein
MKAFLMGVVVAVAIAVTAGIVLKFENETTAARYSTSNVRL